MNDVLGNDLEKKMVVMNLLRQYAEDRNVEQFTKGLNVVLETPQEKEMITTIRYTVISVRIWDAFYTKVPISKEYHRHLGLLATSLYYTVA